MKQLQRVLMGVPVVDDDRHIQILGKGKLLLKDFPLNLPRRSVVIVVVQPDFPQSHRLFIAQLLGDDVQIIPGILGSDFRRLVGVDADGAVDEGIALGKLDAGKVGVGGVADIHDGVHPVLCHRAEQRLAVLIKAWVIIVCVRVKNRLHKGTSELERIDFPN